VTTLLHVRGTFPNFPSLTKRCYAVYDNSRKRLWLFDGLVINNDHLNFEDHKGTGTGDHGVVKVSFKFNPA